MAWVGLLEEATRQIIPVASYGEGTDYLENIQVSVDTDVQFSLGPTDTSFRENRPVWCQDFLHDPKTAPWYDVAAQYHWASSASLPLYREGILVGVLTLYADTTNAFDEEACKLLNEMADDVSFALDNFAREASRKKNEATLKDSEQRFRSLIEQSIAGVYIIQDSKFVYVNPRFAEILGYSNSDELLGLDPMEIVAAKDRRLVEQNLNKLQDGEIMAVSYIFTASHKNGLMVDVGMNSSKATYQGRPAVIGLMQDISDKKVAEEQIKRYATQLQITFMQTVGLVTTLSEIRDPYTAGHERRVAEIAVAIGKELGLDTLQLEGLKVGGYLHDVGKTSIPIEILTKPGKISAIEYELIKVHPQAGYEVLKDVDFPWPVAQIALQHHERIDGSGYPQGLKGDDILFEARIMAVADVIEAMASHRPYRPGLGIDTALAEIERGRGLVYDVAVADACLRLFREKDYKLPN
jgi:PAS domain S-box-containing protein/putative nucleotidyltransferase with HDIG domain